MKISAKPGQLGPCEFPVIETPHLDVINTTEGIMKMCVRTDEDGRAYLRLDRMGGESGHASRLLSSDHLRAMADALDAHSL